MNKNLSPKVVTVVVVLTVVIIGLIYTSLMNSGTSARGKMIDDIVANTVIGGKPPYPGAKPPRSAGMPGGPPVMSIPTSKTPEKAATHKAAPKE